MGHETEFKTKMGVNGKQEKTRNIIFQQKMRKTGEKKNRKKEGEKHQITGKNRKQLKIKRNTEDFDEI